MAEEEETREVLFPDWEGPDKTGLTIEQTSGGELFVKEVKGESPAARSGKVYEGDQIVGATVYFDNMSSEETAELLKTLNRHKVGLKLQNKSPCCSPVSTPCRSPIGTLTWEGKTRFGGSSPDIILSGEDEDYKRIYTKKIKPRLKSEDLAEGVDVRTERHSSTSSDGSTITTITRRITTYTVDMPGGISEQLELSSPEFKGLQQESGDGTSYIRISHGSPSGNVKPEEGVFESSNVSVSGPQVSSTETRWSSGGVQIKTTTREVERDRGPGLGFKGSNFGPTGAKGQGDIEILRGSGEQGDRNIQLSGTSKTLRDSTNTGSKYVTIGGLVGGEVISTDENGGSISMSLPGKSMQILTSSTDKTQEGSADASSGERAKVKVSEEKGSGSTDLPNVRLGGGSMGRDADFRGGRIGGTTTTGITVGNVTSGYSSRPGKISVAGADVNLTGPTLKGEVDVNLPSTKGGIKSSRIDTRGIDTQIRGPSSNIEGPVVSVRLPEADFKAPEINSSIQTNVPKSDSKYKVEVSKVKIPSLSGPDTDLNLKGSKAEGGIDVAVLKPEGELKAPKIDIKGPAINIEGEEGDLKMPQIKIRSYGAKGPRVDIKAPKAGIEAPEVDGEGVKFKMPSKTGPTMPESDISLKGSKVKVEMDVSAPKIERHKTKPEVETNINVKAPGIDIHRADVDTEGPNAKLKEAKFNIPPISGTNISMPSVDFSQKGPELEGDMDVSAPKTEGDIKTPGVVIKGPKSGFGIKTPKMEGPDVDVKLLETSIDVKAPEFDIKGPGFDIEGPEANIRGPEFKLPSISGPKLPDVDMSLEGPTITGDTDMSVPKIVGEMETPKVKIEGQDVNIEGQKGEFKMPKFSLPKFGLKGSKMEGPEVDVSLPKADIDIKAPEVDIKGPELDIEGPSGKIKGPKISMPKISGPKLSMPDVDINLKGPNLKGDVDVSVPKIEGDIKTPDLDIKGPQIDIEGPKGGFEMPKIKMPKFDIKGPKLEGPDVDINLPKGGIDVKMPELDMKAPKVDIEGPDLEIEGSTSGFKMPKFGLPKFGIKSPKVEGPEVDVSLPKADIDIKAPEVDIKGPELDIESPSGKIRGPKFNMPKISGPELSMPDVDINLKGPNLKGDVDVSVPKIEGDIKTPEFDIKGPQIDIEGPKGGFEMPKIKMPKFDIKGPKVEGPDVDINLPKGGIDVKMPELDVKAPKVDIEGPDLDIEGPKGGFKMPKFGLPKFGAKGPKMEGPEVDVSLPKADIDIKAPEVDIKGPELDIESPSGKIRGPKFNMPKISGPNLSMPHVDFNLRGPNLKGDLDVSVPKIEGDIKTPELNIKGPSVEGPQGGFEMPKIKMPSLGPKLEGPSIDINLPKSNIDVKAPHVDYNLKGKMDASAPKLDAAIKGPNTNIAVPTITMEGSSVDPVKTGVTFPKFKGPKFGIKSPELEGKTPTFSVGVKGPKTEVSLPDNEASLDAPDININVKGKKGKFKLPKGKGKVKKPDADIETPAVDLDVDTPHIHVKGTKVKKPLFGKLHFPDVELDIKSPKLKGDGSFSEGFRSPDTDFPSASLNTAIEGSGIGGPNVNVSTSDIDANLNRQGEVSMSAGFKGPKINVKGSGEVDASASGGSATGGLHYPEGTVTFPKIKVPKFGIALPQLEGQGHGENVEAASGGINIQSPSVSCQVSSQNIEVPSPELRHSEGKVKVKMPKLFGKSKAKGSSAGDLRGPEVELSTSGKGGKVHAGELRGGKLELEGDPGLSVSTKSKSASLDLFQRSRHRSSSDEGGLAGSSPSAHLEAEGGDISLDLGGGKVKGKKGKLKFGTFGGFGSKSKGSYEVSLGEESEAGVTLPSKKSRLSSSSSSDSGSRGGFRFPRLELSVSPKK